MGKTFSVSILVFVALALSGAAFAQDQVLSGDLAYLDNLRSLGSLIASPQNIKLEIRDADHDAATAKMGTHYDPSDQTLVLDPATASIPTGTRRTIETHELGHFFFDLGMKKRTPAWDRLDDDTSAERDAKDELEKSIIERAQEDPKTWATFAATWDQARWKNPEWLRHETRWEGFKNLIKVVLAYNELFADFFAAAQQSNPKALTSAVTPLQMGPDTRVFRDFSHRFSTEEFHDWEESTKEYAVHHGYDEHILLAPSYAPVWDAAAKEFGSNGENKPKVVAAVFDLLAKDLTALLQKGPIETIDPGKLNLHLAALLKDFQVHPENARIESSPVEPAPSSSGSRAI